MASHKGSPRRYADGAGGIGIVKSGAFGSELIQVWRFDMWVTITADDCGVVFVAHDE